MEKLCTKITQAAIWEVYELYSNHEQADTRLLLHDKHASLNGINKVGIQSIDTDVYISCLARLHALHCQLYLKTGTGKNKRIVHINEVAEKFAYFELNVTKVNICQALLAVHGFTGCDSISAFSGKVKLKAVKVVFSNESFINGFKNLVSTWIVGEETKLVTEKFVCHLYGYKISSVNELRYKLYCSRAGKVDSESLTPCQNSLSLHIDRANYQVSVGRSALTVIIEYPDIQNNGWLVDFLCPGKEFSWINLHLGSSY